MVETLKIMISSTRADLMPYRKAAAEVIADLVKEWQHKWQILPVGMEVATQTGKREYPVEISKGWVEQSDWVVCIVGWHYGTITDEKGANGIGVTEWEYLHAAQEGKGIFVFLSGEENAAIDAYDGQGDVPKLIRWKKKQTEDQRKKMRDFRGRVDKQHLSFFRNCTHFSELLARTLRKALHDKVSPIAPGSPLAELVLALLDDAFVPCFKSVRLIARSKDIHDALHELRQHVIVQLRDQVVGPWRSAGELSRPQERKLHSVIKKIGEPLGHLQRLRREIDEGEKEKDCVHLCQHLDLLYVRLNGRLMEMPHANEAPDELVSVDEFCETLAECTDSLEKAFSEANRVMLNQQRAFDELYAAMNKKLGDAAAVQRLSQSERQVFKEETDKIAANRQRLVDALRIHAEWQQVHDETVNLAELVTQQVRGFGRRLKDFAHVQGPHLHALCTRVCDALERDEDVDRPLDEALTRLTEAIDTLRSQLEAPVTGGATLAGEEIFLPFCTEFDMGFYLVDKRTQRVISRSRERVEEMEKSFRALGKNPATAGK